MERPRSVDQAYLPSSEQLIIAAKVNRICELEPEDPAPFPLVTDAQDIVRSLHPRIESSGVNVSVESTGRNRFQTFAGATEHGNATSAFDNTQTKKLQIGVREYRIGQFVATRHQGLRFSSIDFESFFDRGAVNQVFGVAPEETRIEYKNSNLSIHSISKLHPVISRITFRIPFFKRFTVNIVRYHGVSIWEQLVSSGKKRRAMREKKLLYKAIK